MQKGRHDEQAHRPRRAPAGTGTVERASRTVLSHPRYRAHKTNPYALHQDEKTQGEGRERPSRSSTAPGVASAKQERRGNAHGSRDEPKSRSRLSRDGDFKRNGRPARRRTGHKPKQARAVDSARRWGDRFEPGETRVPTGTVKWFNATKGYGFIAPEDGSKDVFVHISAVERAGLGTLRENQRVTFEVRPGRDGRTSAEELAAID